MASVIYENRLMGGTLDDVRLLRPMLDDLLKKHGLPIDPHPFGSAIGTESFGVVAMYESPNLRLAHLSSNLGDEELSLGNLFIANSKEKGLTDLLINDLMELYRSQGYEHLRHKEMD